MTIASKLSQMSSALKEGVSWFKQWMVKYLPMLKWQKLGSYSKVIIENNHLHEQDRREVILFLKMESAVFRSS